MGCYVVETEPMRRGQVDWAVRDAIAAMGFKTLLIETPRITPSKRAFETPSILVMPRYVFVQLDLAADKFSWPDILQIRGVKTMLGITATRPIPSSLRPKDFERLQELAENLANQKLAPETKIVPLKEGQVVRILWGAMPGVFGTIEFDNGIRADVLLASAGVASKVSLPRELIEAI